mgnify:CR=1 FL=1
MVGHKWGCCAGTYTVQSGVSSAPHHTRRSCHYPPCQPHHFVCIRFWMVPHSQLHTHREWFVIACLSLLLFCCQDTLSNIASKCGTSLFTLEGANSQVRYVSELAHKQRAYVQSISMHGNSSGCVVSLSSDACLVQQRSSYRAAEMHTFCSVAESDCLCSYYADLRLQRDFAR